jgi:hypothetical protein
MACYGLVNVAEINRVLLCRFGATSNRGIIRDIESGDYRCDETDRARLGLTASTAILISGAFAVSPNGKLKSIGAPLDDFDLFYTGGRIYF